MKIFGIRKNSTREQDMARGAYLFRVTEDILVAMEDGEVTKAELAKRLGKSKARISQLLGGDSNMTIGTLSDIAFALGLTLGKTFREYSDRRYKLAEEPEQGVDYVSSDFARCSMKNIRTKALESLASNDEWTDAPDNIVPFRRTA